MLRAIILSGLLAAILAPAAAAASGNGLYKPYPAAVGSGGARSYYARLGHRPTQAQLAVGVFRHGFAAAAAGGPSERAGATPVGLGLWEVLVGAAAALAAGALAAARRARG
jgi:hypothetical protein